MGKLHRLQDTRQWRARYNPPTFFSRSELNLLLSLYSRRVMSGEWRDYAIDQKAGMAIFSIYRHSHDRPLFTVAKRPGRSGTEYMVCRDREKLARARSLSEALSVFRRHLRIVT